VNKITREISYLEAETNPKLRQPYLDGIMPQCPESVEALVYDPNGKELDKYTELLTEEEHFKPNQIGREKPSKNPTYFDVVYSTSILGNGKKHPIFISDAGFDSTQYEPVILNLILDHEAFHTSDLMYGIRMQDCLINYDNVGELRGEVLMNLLEIRAYKNQLGMIEVRGIKDKSFGSWILFEIDSCQRELRSVNPKSELERKVLRDIDV